MIKLFYFYIKIKHTLITEDIKMDIKKLEGKKTIRAGVIPYTLTNQNLYFLFGVDELTSEFTDFGGGVKINEDCVEGAIREFKEETYEFLPKENYDKNSEEFNKSIAITDEDRMTMIFLKVDSKWLTNSEKKFFDNKKKSKLRYHEIKNIVWVSENELKKLIKNPFPNFFDNKKKGVLWSKIRNFLEFYNNDEFYKSLKNIKV